MLIEKSCPHRGFTRKARKAETRRIVLEAAKVVFAGGYEAATMRAIANAAGMSTGAIFAHWPDKASLYKEVTGHPPVSPEIGAGLLSVIRRAIQPDGQFDRDRAAALVAQFEGS